jgi:hypothetical protein
MQARLSSTACLALLAAALAGLTTTATAQATTYLTLGTGNASNATTSLSGSAATELSVATSSTTAGAVAVLGKTISASAAPDSAAVKGINLGNGTGLFGRNGNNVPSGYGVYGEGRYGVVGKSLFGGASSGVYGTSGTGFAGVEGHSSAAGGYGLYGQNSAGGTGVYGTSGSGRGVAGFSTSGQAVYGHSGSQVGVLGDSDSFDGVWGSTDSGTAAGVSGHNSAGGYGVFGASTGDGSKGVYGTGTYGVWGTGTGGVHGEGTLNGVFGYSQNGDALLGNSPNGYAVRGVSTNGYAGYFNGRTYAASLEVGGTVGPNGVLAADGTANGVGAIALGGGANAKNLESFVWSDGNWTGGSVTSPRDRSFTAHATGGFNLWTNATGGAGATGCTIAPGGGTWNCTSSRAEKRSFATVDRERLLRRLARIPITTWRYKGERPHVRHIGPMAQDFSRAFAVGENDRTISMVDADGVSLAAIQGLYRENLDLRLRVATQSRQLRSLDARLTRLERKR